MLPCTNDFRDLGFGFEKKVKKLFGRRCWRFSIMRSLGVGRVFAAAKRPVGKGRDDICLVGSQSPMTDVALRMASTGLPYLVSRTKTRCVPAPFIAGPCRRIRPANRVQKTEMSVQDWAWSKFLTHQGADL